MIESAEPARNSVRIVKVHNARILPRGKYGPTWTISYQVRQSEVLDIIAGRHNLPAWEGW